MSLTIQSLLKAKLFGNYLQGTQALRYRVDDWQKLVRGRERAARLISKSLFGVPSAHHGDLDHQMWCFQFADGGQLVAYLSKGHSSLQFAAHNEDESADVKEAVDFLLSSFEVRLRAL